MGQEIVYCHKCQIRLLGSDFESGKAFRIDSQAACPACARALVAHLPDPDAELERLKRSQVSRVSGVFTKLPAARSSMESTSRIPAQPRSPVRDLPAAPPAKSPLPLLLGVGGVLLVLILGAVAMSTGPSTPARPSTPNVPLPDPLPPKPLLPDPPTDKIAQELEELDARTVLFLRKDQIPEAARLIGAARGNHSSLDWIRGIDERTGRLEAAARRVAAPLLEQVELAARKGATDTLQDLRRRLEALGVPALTNDYLRAVAAAEANPWIVLDLDHLTSEGGAVLTKRGDLSVLVSGQNPDNDVFRTTARLGLRQVRAFRVEALPDASLPAGGPGRAGNGNIVLSEFMVSAEGRPLVFSGASSDFEQDQYPSSAAIDGNPLTGWALSGRLGQASAAVFYLEKPTDLETVSISLDHRSNHPKHVLGCFRVSVSVLALPLPPPPRPAEATQIKSEKPLAVPPAVLAYQQGWAKAGRFAADRDFASAMKTLDEARAATKDDLRKEADADLADLKLVAEAIAEVPRLLPRWAKGMKVHVSFIGEAGTADALDGVLLDVSLRGLTLQADGGSIEIPSGELAADSIAALTTLRGEKKPGDARAMAVLAALEGHPSPDLLKKYGGLAIAPDSRESEARRLFWAAEEDYANVRTRGRSGAPYTTLLEKLGQTAFTLRNRAIIEEHLAGTRDAFFFAEDLSGAGTFSIASSAKMESYWMSSADSPPGKAAANFLEAELVVQPNATVRAWVYAGGCCQEVFTFFLQGSGLSGPSAKNPKETVTAEPGGEEWIAGKAPSLSLKKKHSDHTGPKEPDRWAWIELGTLRFAEPGVKKLRILTEQKGFSVAYVVVSAIRQSPPRESEVKDLLKIRPAPDFWPTGSILREIWRGIPGDAVTDLTNNPRFKEGKPDLSGPISAIDSWNMGDQYGCRIRGYVHPPATGDYIFWIASDDWSELWLSSDDTPMKKQKICGLNHAVGQRDWNADPSQKSAAIPLSAGRRYYIEALQKQGGGGEHVAVGWQLPGGSQERPIGPNRVSPVGALPSRKIARPVLYSPPLDGSLMRTPVIGGGGGAPFEQSQSPRQFVRGFRYALTSAGSLLGLQALYLGDTEGAPVGNGPLHQEVVAPTGYAVAGMVARGTDRLNSFKLIYMRVSGTRLVASDRRESDWVGTRVGGAETPLGGTGTPVLGFCGRAANEIDAAGLILLAP